MDDSHIGNKQRWLLKFDQCESFAVVDVARDLRVGFLKLFRPTARSFQSLSNHTHKLAYYRYSQYVISYSWIRSFMLLDIQLLYLALAKTLVIGTNLDLCLC